MYKHVGSIWFPDSRKCNVAESPGLAPADGSASIHQSINKSLVVSLSVACRSGQNIQNCPVYSTMARSFESSSCPLSHFARPEFFVQTLQLAEGEMARKPV